VSIRRPLIAAGAVLFALGAFYSLAAPWLAQRQLASATSAADLKRAHAWDPLSTRVLMTWAAYENADPLRAEQLYHQAVSLEPQNSETWYELGLFYADNGAWKLAYGALSKAWTYDRFGPAGTRCGLLDQARHKVFHVWPPNCPRGRPRAATP
jgi:tetratricopeptide (TPR) repeat protein